MRCSTGRRSVRFAIHFANADEIAFLFTYSCNKWYERRISAASIGAEVRDPFVHVNPCIIVRESLRTLSIVRSLRIAAF